MAHKGVKKGFVAGLAIAAGLGLAGCGGSSSSDTQVKRAEAQVTAKQKTLSEAKSTFKTSSAAFCGSAQTYITAIDRYGDVLHTTTTTLGDVKTAGSDLVSPQQDAMTAAEQAVSDQQAVVDAKNELADAQAALKVAKGSSGSASAQPSPTVSSATAKPLAPAATVNRVKTAESEFDAAVKGITDQTPLTRASQEFNAAAVALEMSWLRLFADAGCLTDEQHVQAEAAVRDYTVTLQQSLTQAGYFHGKVDGVYGPATVEAVKALQQAHGLPVTGTVDKATEQALQSELAKVGGVAAQEAVASTAAVQQTLRLAGFWDGPVDGNWTPELTAALKSFQTELGVKPTGAVDAATIAALETAIAAAGQTPTPTPSSPPTSPTASGSPSAGS